MGKDVHVESRNSWCVGFLAIGETLLVQSVPESSLWGGAIREGRTGIGFFCSTRDLCCMQCLLDITQLHQ